jgi:hypothetical protein
VLEPEHKLEGPNLHPLCVFRRSLFVYVIVLKRWALFNDATGLEEKEGVVVRWP